MAVGLETSLLTALRPERNTIHLAAVGLRFGRGLGGRGSFRLELNLERARAKDGIMRDERTSRS